MSLLEVCEESCHMQHRVTSDLEQRLECVIKNHHRFYSHVRCSPPQSLSSIAHAHIICLRYKYYTMELDFTTGVWISANGIALRIVGGGEVRVAEGGGEVRAGKLRSDVFASPPACACPMELFGEHILFVFAPEPETG